MQTEGATLRCLVIMWVRVDSGSSQFPPVTLHTPPPTHPAQKDFITLFVALRNHYDKSSTDIKKIKTMGTTCQATSNLLCQRKYFSSCHEDWKKIRNRPSIGSSLKVAPLPFPPFSLLPPTSPFFSPSLSPVESNRAINALRGLLKTHFLCSHLHLLLQQEDIPLSDAKV